MGTGPVKAEGRAGPASTAYLPTGPGATAGKPGGTVTLDLWEQSSEDVRERWRDIARTLRDTGDAEAMPRALQTAFWFGAEAVKRASVASKFDATLRSLLPPERIALLRGPALAPSAGPKAAPKR